MNFRSKLAEGLMILIAVAVVAQVVWGLIGPLLPALVVLAMLGALLFWVLRGPRIGH